MVWVQFGTCIFSNQQLQSESRLQMHLVLSNPFISRTNKQPSFYRKRQKKGKIFTVLKKLTITPWRHMGKWMYSSSILNLSLSWRWVVSITPRRIYPEERDPDTQWLGRWMGPRAGLDAVKKRKVSFPCWESNPGRPASSTLLYKLSYPGSCYSVSCLFCKQ
jgi:hypothetical protein